MAAGLSPSVPPAGSPTIPDSSDAGLEISILEPLPGAGNGNHLTIADAMPHIVFTAIRDGSVVYCNRAWFDYTGLSEGKTYAGDWHSAIHPDDTPGFAATWLDVMVRGADHERETQLRLRRASDGMFRWFAVRTTPVRDATGATVKWIGSGADIHDLKCTQAELLVADARNRALIDAMPQMVWVADEHTKVDYVNARWTAYTGLDFEPGSISKSNVIIHADDLGVLAEAHATLRARGSVNFEARMRRHDGVYLWHLVRTVPLGEDSSGVMKIIVTATDIEAQKSAEAALADSVAQLTHRAHHDPLTSLPNRTHLIDRLTAMIAEAEHDGTNVVVLYLDVDHFKTVNDTLGHEAGDQLLVEIATRINANLRAEDIASRLGGDEFVLVCRADGAVDAAAVAERLQAAVRTPIELNGKRVVVASSIGISLYPTDGVTPAELMQKADAAMYEAKESGRDAWCFYNAAAVLPSAVVPALDLELQLREAIAREQFVVYYQPIIDIASGRAIGAEALVRWAHPERGVLAPGEFIAFAENHGMIAQIGDYVLNAACAQLARLNLRPNDDFSIAVNVSARQFARPSFVGTIATAVAFHGIDPRRLEIEITESVVMADTAAVVATLERLRSLGVRLSMDDFGTGYSSLAYIKNFPIHTLKIDRSFITDIAKNFTDQAIAKTIVTLAHSLGMRTIAEGVETVDQLERLRAFGADCFQGYLISRPLPPLEFEAYLAVRSTNGAKQSTAIADRLPPGSKSSIC
jgi:diguanylate cyclase (GGDEF)-like protein/PAS domain S-box-containing protein